MTTPQTFTVAPDMTSTATFRAWGLAVSTALQALGNLTKTTDTGQIDWTSVAVPGTAPTVAGYEIYRFKDAFQAASPIFIKVDYGTGAATNRPSVGITVGTTTDGAGNLGSMAGNGITLTTRQVLSGAIGSASPAQCFINGDDSTLMIALWPAGGQGGVFLLERARDTSGNPTGDGFATILGSNNAVFHNTIMHHNQLPQVGQNGYVLCLGGPFSSYIKDSIMYTIPVMTGIVPRYGAPSAYMVAVSRTDLAAGATFPMTHYGASRNWISFGANMSAGNVSALGAATLTYAVRTN